MGDAAGHLPKSSQALLLHDRLLCLPQVVIGPPQRCVELGLVRCQRYVFTHLPQKLAFAAAEGMCFPTSRNKDSEDFALDQQRGHNQGV
jgi:hypothetical protein